MVVLAVIAFDCKAQQLCKGYTDLTNVYEWKLATVPGGQPQLFPEGNITTLEYGYNRAKLAWFTVDPALTTKTSVTPANISSDDQSDPYTRAVTGRELYPDDTNATGGSGYIPTFNLAYFPNLRGPYNYDVTGTNPDGTLINPNSRWAGISRPLSTTDLEAGHYGFIELLIMDPFVENDSSNNSGQLYINLGNVSEDLLPDRCQSFENGVLSGSPPDTVLCKTTPWAHVPQWQQSFTPGFSNDPAERAKQDVGLDGLIDTGERSFRQDFLTAMGNKFGTGSSVYQDAFNDPSTDDFHFWKGDDYDGSVHYSILERYKKWNGMEGNSGLNGMANTGIPDNEDLNRNNVLDTLESYYQYKINISTKGDLAVGKNYVTAVIPTMANLENGKTMAVNWYQLEIPIHSPDQVIGTMKDLSSVNYMRMFFKGFTDSVVVRFARLQLTNMVPCQYGDGSRMEVYPNPNDGTFNLSMQNIADVQDVLQVTIINAGGAVIYHLDGLSNNVTTFAIANLSAGLYAIKVNLKDGETLVRKFIVQQKK